MVKINRRSQGMPVNVIIIAVLALIVLVVLTVIFTGRVRIFSSTLESCSAKQGHCIDKCGDNEAMVIAQCPEKADPSTYTKCCVQVLNP